MKSVLELISQRAKIDHIKPEKAAQSNQREYDAQITVQFDKIGLNIAQLMRLSAENKLYFRNEMGQIQRFGI